MKQSTGPPAIGKKTTATKDAAVTVPSEPVFNTANVRYYLPSFGGLFFLLSIVEKFMAVYRLNKRSQKPTVLQKLLIGVCDMVPKSGPEFSFKRFPIDNALKNDFLIGQVDMLQDQLFTSFHMALRKLEIYERMGSFKTIHKSLAIKSFHELGLFSMLQIITTPSVITEGFIEIVPPKICEETFILYSENYNNNK
uniref:Uncharacterized protein n=1 Tax=Glossina pallidipes TaxID=7398 RepID=A0A1A9Z8L9_GLOPL